MKVFIGWSGESSRSFAAELANWLSTMFPQLNVFYSGDIPKGKRWRHELDEALRKVEFGVFCVTPDNVESTWMHFEVGAISARIKAESNVCPLLIGVEERDLSNLLNEFQCAKADEFGMRKLVRAINERLPEQERLSDVEDAFSKHWPKMKTIIRDTRTALRQEEYNPARKLQEVLRRLHKLELPAGLFTECLRYGFVHFAEWAMCINDNSFHFEEPLQMREVGIAILNSLQRNGFMSMYFPDFDAWRADADPGTDDDYLKACRDVNKNDVNKKRKRKILLTRVYVLGNDKDLKNPAFQHLSKADRRAGIDTYFILRERHPTGIPFDWAIWDDELVCISHLKSTSDRKVIIGCEYHRDAARIRHAAEWRNKVLNIAKRFGR